MNQEQNNLNQNNFNTQGYDDGPNNQPLHYQNQNIEETRLSEQQPPNYQNLDTQKNKKNNFKLIIGIMAIIAIVLIAVGLFLLPKNKDNASNPAKSNIKNNMKSNIKQMTIGTPLLNGPTIVALSDNEDLYYVEGELGKKVDTKDIKKVASNIEKFHNATAIYFIDKNHDLFYSGCSYNMGCSDEAKKDYSNVKDINVYGNFCGFIINDNNELLITNNSYGVEFCGLNKKYSDFTKIADNVRETIVYDLFSGYINYDNELYISTANADFKKVLDDVKSTSAYGYCSLLILTNNNKLYLYEKDESENYKLHLLKDDVKELKNNYFQTINGDYNVISNRKNLGLIKGESKVLYDTIYYGVLDIKDIKEIIYYISEEWFNGEDSYKQKMIIYISKDGNLVLQNENTKKKIAYNTDNLAEILNFVLEKTPIDEK